MKVVAINGSPKEKGNTYHAIKTMADVLSTHGIETEILHVGGQVIRGCMACSGCRKSEGNLCVLPGDCVAEYTKKMLEADGIILGSPVYYGGIAGTMKSFLDRVFYGNSSNMRHKVGYAVTAVRRAGAVPTFQQLCSYLNLGEMIIAPSVYWGVGYGRLPGEITGDEEGEDTLTIAAENMAWLLKMKEATKDTILPPAQKTKRLTNFIR
ncbi:MAG: flavodoxin family protein [Clostridiales bacterium]|nr:flavodoxin family protein [Clostridiales bacterium]